MNLYIAYSERFAARLGMPHMQYRTARMALHPDLPDVHTLRRQKEDMRPYRMVYCRYRDEGERIEDMVFHPSCLGSNVEEVLMLFRNMNFDEAIEWLLEGKEKSR